MRPTPNPLVEPYRLQGGIWGNSGHNGAFQFPNMVAETMRDTLARRPDAWIKQP